MYFFFLLSSPLPSFPPLASPRLSFPSLSSPSLFPSLSPFLSIEQEGGKASSRKPHKKPLGFAGWLLLSPQCSL